MQDLRSFLVGVMVGTVFAFLTIVLTSCINLSVIVENVGGDRMSEPEITIPGVTTPEFGGD